jgi:hypothetical protein
MNKDKKPEFNQRLDEIYCDIIHIKVKPTDSFESLLKKFYAVMRKWGIKQGTWSDNGSRCVNNAEWNMCYQVFKEHKILSYDLWMCLNTPPKDLLAYGKKPKQKPLLPKIKQINKKFSNDSLKLS